MLFRGMTEQTKTVVDPGIDRRREYTIFFHNNLYKRQLAHPASYML